MPSVHVPEAAASPQTRPPSVSTGANPSWGDYFQVVSALAVLGAAIAYRLQQAPPQPVAARSLLVPALAMVALVGFVWALMVVFRNYAILRGLALASYYRDYASDPPSEWIERPARAFNNLLEVPTLFYVLVAFTMLVGETDSGQLELAWAFVAMRALHATIYVGWNYVPWRFGAYVGGVIVLAVMYFRFAATVL